MSAPLPVLSPSMHLAGGKDRKSGRGCSKVITAEEARLPEEESAAKDRGALEARLERAERSLAKLQQKLIRQAQYSFQRFNSLRTEYEWGRRIYKNARANAKDGVETMEWLDSNEAKDLTGFGYDAMYEDLHGPVVEPQPTEMFEDSDLDDGSQDISGFESRAGSIKSATSTSANRGCTRPCDQAAGCPRSETGIRSRRRITD